MKNILLNIRPYITIVFLILSSSTSFGQTQLGTGVNVGIQEFGIEIQTYSFERLKAYANAELRRYSAISTSLGAGMAIRPRTEQHNFWINSSFEYKFANSYTLERNDVFYTYEISKLNYWNLEGAYSFRLDKNFLDDRFILLEVKMISKQLLNTMNVEPSPSNTAAFLVHESRIRRYFYSGITFGLGVKFVW